MLNLSIRPEDVNKTILTSENRFSFGSSFVEPFCSHHILSEVHLGLDNAVIWIGEDKCPFFPIESIEDLNVKCRSHTDCEGVLIIMDHKRASAPLGIVRTLTGTSPLYLSTSPTRILASWRFEDVVADIASPQPNRDACKIFLNHGSCPVRDQVIVGVSALWPGESVAFNKGEAIFLEASSSEIVLSSTITDSARVSEAFLEVVAHAMERALMRSCRAMVEVSGGYDSSCVAIASRIIRDDLNSYGLIHEGKAGRQQRVRRRELVEMLKLKDFEYPSEAFPPFAALVEAECSTTVNDDSYRMSCVRAVEAHPEYTPDLLITGIGGDELTMENTFYRAEWEVAGSVCNSAIGAAVGRTDMFMRRGIWVSQPLVHPQVVNFCRSLPPALRANRMLNVLVLARAGLSDGFIFPRYREHYGNLLLREGNAIDFDQLLSNSVVLEWFTEDVYPLLKQAREEPYSLSLELITKLFYVAKLETVLSRYLR